MVVVVVVVEKHITDQQLKMVVYQVVLVVGQEVVLYDLFLLITQTQVIQLIMGVKVVKDNILVNLTMFVVVEQETLQVVHKEFQLVEQMEQVV
jgi:hypothetical protein